MPYNGRRYAGAGGRRGERERERRGVDDREMKDGRTRVFPARRRGQRGRHLRL